MATVRKVINGDPEWDVNNDDRYYELDGNSDPTTHPDGKNIVYTVAFLQAAVDGMTAKKVAKAASLDTRIGVCNDIKDSINALP